MILEQDCYHLHRATEDRKCGNATPWAVGMKLGWMLSRPLPQHDTANLATESLVAAQMGPLADQVKSWWNMELYAKPTVAYPEGPRNITGNSKCSRQPQKSMERGMSLGYFRLMQSRISQTTTVQQKVN